MSEKERILRKYIKECCKKAWMARTMREITSAPHGWKAKYKTFNDWWRKNKP